ncbi:rCG53897 [Rattus norvegicus]|uniref:RCG53897 n=1 Tax=Rattus norvegicus TaxID=10116 RepID=A6JAD9_RAT|nr:rCG53897 [Rattus norvegicus]
MGVMSRTAMWLGSLEPLAKGGVTGLDDNSIINCLGSGPYSSCVVLSFLHRHQQNIRVPVLSVSGKSCYFPIH